MISNFAYAPTLYESLDQFGIRSAFETVVVSAEVGCCKPHRAIFDHAFEQMGIRPAEALFIGDQLYVDLDLSEHNLPPGTRLQVGSAIIAVTEPPHLGCSKFAERFGPNARRFVNSPIGRELRLRGVNARIIVPGTVRVGDTIQKVSSKS